MNLYDPSVADAVVVKVLGTVVAVVVTALGIWQRFYRTRKVVASDEGDRQRMQDAITDAREARKDANDVRNEMMAMQRTLGRLEAENHDCNRRADRQDIEIAALKRQNSDQAEQIAALWKKKTVNPTASDFEPRP